MAVFQQRSAGLVGSTLYTWGNNSNSHPLGNPNNTDSVVGRPMSLPGSWVTVAMGGTHTVAVKSDGTVWAWGNNFEGQLGDDTIPDSDEPIPVSSESGFSRVWAGQNISFAGKGTEENFELYSFGICEWGQSGTGVSGTGCIQPAMTRVGNDMYRAIGAGWSHVVAVATDGRLWGWGENPEGQIGTAAAIQTTPRQIGTDSDWHAVSGGRDTSAGLRSDGTAWMWGENINDKMFGDKSLPNESRTPLRVANNP